MRITQLLASGLLAAALPVHFAVADEKVEQPHWRGSIMNFTQSSH